MGLTSPSAQTASTSSYQIPAKPKERLQRAKIFVILNSFIVVAVLLTFKKQSMCLREINPNNAERQKMKNQSLSPSALTHPFLPSSVFQEEVHV